METVMRLAGEHQKAMPKRFRFNVTSLAAVKVPEGEDRVWVYDTLVPKLAFLRTARGSTSFYLVYKLNGRMRRYRIGDGDLPVDAVRKMTAAPIAKIAQGIDPQAERQSSRAAESFSGAWMAFMEKHVRPRLRTADEIQQKYDKYLKPWANRKFDSITRSEVAALHRRIGNGDDGRPGAANRLIRLISSFYNWTNEEREIEDGPNPARNLRMFPEHKRERYLQPDELPNFYKGLKHVSQDMSDLFELALYTGARIGNIRSMAWAEIDFTSAIWTIPATKFKTGKAVMVPLVDQAAVILLKRLGAQQKAAAKEAKENKTDLVKPVYVFPSIGETGFLQEHKKAWETVCEKGGLTDLHCHDLRHSLASWQLDQGANLSIIGRALGHATQATTARYAHVQMNPVRTSMKAAVDAICKAGKTKQSKKKQTIVKS